MLPLWAAYPKGPMSYRAARQIFVYPSIHMSIQWTVSIFPICPFYVTYQAEIGYGLKGLYQNINCQWYPLPCCTNSGNLKCAQQGRGYFWPLLVPVFLSYLIICSIISYCYHISSWDSQRPLAIPTISRRSYDICSISRHPYHPSALKTHRYHLLPPSPLPSVFIGIYR